jgi:hypothetical protein
MAVASTPYENGGARRKYPVGYAPARGTARAVPENAGGRGDPVRPVHHGSFGKNLLNLAERTWVLVCGEPVVAGFVQGGRDRALR